MALPLLIAAAALIGAAGIAGCGGSQKKKPRNAEEAKEAISPAEKPSQAYREECGELEEYGELYVDTCSYYADQCYTQKVLEDKTEMFVEGWGTIYSGHSYDECLEKSRYYAKRRGPLPYEKLSKRFRWPLSTHLLLQHESVSAAMDPRNHSEKWKPIAERMLVERGLLKQGEGIEKVINGRIAGARVSKSSKKELIIVMLDSHDDENVQSQIVNNLDELHKRGIKLIGVENIHAFGELACDPTRNDVASIMLACKIGSSGSVIGVEDRKTHITHLLVLNHLMNLNDISSNEKICDWLKANATMMSLAILRSSLMVSNLLALMKSEFKENDEAALIIGGGHFRDIKAIFDAEDINYIAIAVPAFDPLTIESIDRRHDMYRPIPEYTEEINLVCDS